ncbi:unnamed protein product, partial [Coregonus sp. 'balchen']
VSEEGPAGQAGVKVGDKLLEVNGVALQGAEHHTAVEALRSSGATVSMSILREHMVEPENAITTTPLRPEDDYFPRERRASGLPFSIEAGSPAGPRHRLSTCLVRNDKGLGFSIAGGKGSTAYRTGDMINGVDMTEARHDQAVALLTGTSPTIALLVERDQAEPGTAGGSPGLSRARAHSPPPPEPSDSPDQEEGNDDSSLLPHGNHLSQPLEDEYPIEVNTIDLRHATHQEAVRALLSNKQEIRMLVRRDPSPPGMEDIVIQKQPGEKLGISIRGGAKGHAGNPFDATDEGIFISKVSSSGAAARDGRLLVGMRILEVSNHSLLGMTHTEAVRVLRAVGDTLVILVCDGFDPGNAAAIEASPGIIANPFAAGIVRKNSMESISSIDRDLSPEEMDILQKEVVRETSQWESEEMEEVERMRLEREEDTRLLEEETENLGTGPLKLDYRTLAALPTTALQKVNRLSPSVSATVPTEAPMQAQCSFPLEPLGFGLGQPPTSLFHVDPHALPQSCPTMNTEAEPLYMSQHSPSPSITSSNQEAARQEALPTGEDEEEVVLVDSQPINFTENPFLVANRRSKGLPPSERILSGPHVGYGSAGKLQPWRPPLSPPGQTVPLEMPRTHLAHNRAHSSTSSLCAGRETRFASIHFTPTALPAKENNSPYEPLSRGGGRQITSPATPDGHSRDGHSSPNPFQHGPSPINSQSFLQPCFPSPDTIDEFPLNPKQAYKAFAAVPHSLAVLEPPPQDQFGQRNNVHPNQPSPSPEPELNNEVFEDEVEGDGGVGRGQAAPVSPRPSLSSDRRDYMSLAAVPRLSRASMDMVVKTPSPGGRDSLEQRSFRDRQKYFEIDVKQQTPDSKPKGRVSLVGADDLKKMREEEERRFEQRAREYLMDDDDEEEDDLVTQMGVLKATGKVLLDGVEYKVEPVATPPRHCNTPPSYCGSSGPSLVDGKGDSQRNSLEESFRLEQQRPNSMTGLIPVYPGESGAPIRTAKAERRQQERLRMQKEDVRQYEQDLAKRLYQSRVRASQGTAPPPQSQNAATSSAASQLRMKSLEQDALKAQMVIAKSREGKKRGTMDQLAESPSPAPTPSPTPLEDFSPQGVTSPGRLSLSEKKFDYRQFAAIPSSKPVYDIQSPDVVDDIQFIDDGSSNPGARCTAHCHLGAGGDGPLQQQAQAEAGPPQPGDRRAHITPHAHLPQETRDTYTHRGGTGSLHTLTGLGDASHVTTTETMMLIINTHTHTHHVISCVPVLPLQSEDVLA